MICRIFYPMKLDGEYNPVFEALTNDALEREYSEHDLKEAMYWYRKKFNEDFNDYLIAYDTNQAVRVILNCLDYNVSLPESFENHSKIYFEMFDEQ
ncbi:hypothetical protein [Macrococcus equi]|uniref:hypothetical protein n=1 Tax=Macrococcus equi TaxID=3395462 RepID=UPI0039BEC01B